MSNTQEVIKYKCEALDEKVEFYLDYYVRPESDYKKLTGFRCNKSHICTQLKKIKSGFDWSSCPLYSSLKIKGIL